MSTIALNALASSQTIGTSGGTQISFSGSEVRWGGVALLVSSGDGSALTGITSGQISGLGTAAVLNVGTGANNIVQLDGSGNLPAVDGSALTGLLSSQVTDLGTAATLDVGTSENNVVQLGAGGALPAVDGSALTGISAGLQESDLDSIDNAQAIGWADAQISRTGAGVVAIPALNLTDTIYGPNNSRVDFASAGSGVVRISGGSTTEASVQASRGGFILDEDTPLQWSGDGQRVDQGIGTTGISLHKDAAGTLAQRNGTNAQAFHLYNTYTDASNYERFVFEWDTNTMLLSPQAAGTGTYRALDIRFGDPTRGGRIYEANPANGGLTIDGQTGSINVQSNTTIAIGKHFRCNSDLLFNSLTNVMRATTAGTTSLGTTAFPFSDIFLRPSSSLTPTSNGDLCIEATNDTTLTFRYKGSDSVVRSGTVTLS